jgi:predicted transcriptional regulator
MAISPGPQLSRRERQIMDSLYRRGSATVLDIQRDLPDAPTDSAIRAMLRLLEAKGQVKRVDSVRPHVYSPKVDSAKAAGSAVRHLLRTFFDGSRERAIQAILESSDTKLNAEEVARLEELVAKARRRGKHER